MNVDGKILVACLIAGGAAAHSIWLRSVMIDRIELAESNAQHASNIATKAAQAADEAQTSALASRSEIAALRRSGADAIHEYDRVKLRDCDELFGERRCKLVK